MFCYILKHLLVKVLNKWIKYHIYKDTKRIYEIEVSLLQNFINTNNTNATKLLKNYYHNIYKYLQKYLEYLQNILVIHQLKVDR